MLFKALSYQRFVRALCLCVSALVCVTTAQAQQPEPTPPEQSGEVLRVSSDIVQTDVMVFDKQGRFVENLQREQFELRVDGKTQPIAFFERVKSGSISEDAQLAAARGNARADSNSDEAGKVVPLDRGRVVLFYVDDLHLAADSIKRTREMLLQFVDRELGQNDEAVIASASGQIGFLQQLTGDKTVLRAAIERLVVRPYTVRDFERPAMTESQALAIARYDTDVTDFFVGRFLADNPGYPRDAVVETVRRRAHSLLQQAGGVTANTLQALINLVRSAAQIPGRKLVFFISDGFLIDDQTSNITSSLRRIGDAAARNGVVIYSIDARGVASGTTEASLEMVVDPTNQLTRTGTNDIINTQEPLRMLASETGGRALLNTNAISAVATEAIKETASYYLLAWRPEGNPQDNKFRKIEASIIGRPDLIVRMRRGFIEQVEKAKPRNKANDARRAETKATVDDALLDAVQSRFPLTNLPTSLFVSYADAASTGTYITASMEVDSAALTFAPSGDKQVAVVDLAGIIFNDQGKSVSSFQNQLRVQPLEANSTATTRQQRGVAYNYQAKLKPGLYQVRVAARDPKSGRAGSAIQWIEVPDLASHRLQMSSLVVGERPLKAVETKDEAISSSVFLSISRRFTQSSKLRFLTEIYNAVRSADGEKVPDVALQVQIFRDNQPVLMTALSKVQTKGVPDLARLPYAAEINLDAMPAGRYLLQVTVIDRIAKTSATQRITFEIG